MDFVKKSFGPPWPLGLVSRGVRHGHIKPVMLQCRTPQETNPKGHWGPNCFLIKSLFVFLPGGPGMSWVSECSHDGLRPYAGQARPTGVQSEKA